jgi:putative oxidoreductase
MITVYSQFQQALSLYGLPVARVMLAVVFLYSGQDKLRHWRESVAEVETMRLPLPAVFAAATILTQLLGGAALALGLGAAVGAALLALFTIAATVLGHRFWLLHGNAARQEFTTSLEHVAIVGGLLSIVVRAF